MDSKVVSALKKLGVIFSSLNVTVKVGAYCASTDGNEIRIPFPDAKTDFQMLTALLMHEASHCRYTDFKADFQSNKLVHSFVNAIEDARIEALIGQVYAGSSFMFKDLYLKMLPKIVSRMIGQNTIQVFGLWLNCRAFVFFGKPYVEEYEKKIGEYLRTVFPSQMLDQVSGLMDRRLPGLKSTSDVVDLSKEIFDIFVPCLKAMMKSRGDPQEGDGEGNGENASDSDELFDGDSSGNAEGSKSNGANGSKPGSETEDKTSEDGDGNGSGEGETVPENGAGADAKEDAESDSSDKADSSAGSQKASGGTSGAATPLTDGERSALLEELEGNGQEIPEENLMEAKELLNKMRDRKEPVAGLVQITHSSREQVSRKPLQDGTRGAERIMKAQDCARRIRNALMGLIEAKARSYSYYSDSGLKIDKRRISRLAVWDTKVFRKKDEVKGEDCAIMLLADTSGSMERDWVEEEYAACLGIALALRNERNVDVGFTTFSSCAEQILPLGAKSLLAYQTEIGASFHRNSTRTDLALIAALQELSFSNRKRKIVLVMTDGQSDNTLDTRQAIEALNRNHCEVYALGIGCRVWEADLYQGCFSIPDISALAQTLTDFAKISIRLGRKAV
ncbi:VWA domain-containing protein [Parasutterella excrementihominis]|uniref:VWA domain-containing protein n=1 Tax=Parasutterella excrementihominis TaxID=487175 RepID=A0A6I3S3H9_9BURK|nr:VWA domain-containing protein [Parasutterella excrementihominis]KAA3141716.1 VWA domain-containing protein [Alistipes indistinctus]KAA3379337.1 VWA domain-containing protein [Akkermansia muciniphila]MTN55309.1 VWA domain-containing protein [Turicibacter sanguinis]MTN67371.1 VWA domain-containing protein [Turicibacter sanguinis]MTT73540.1 VWA domain-containing protein [Parasutterella excrementihominis]